MSDLLTAIAGLVLVAVFPIAIIAVYRWQARQEEKFQRWMEEDSAAVRKWADEQRDTIERRARKEM